MKPIDHKQIQFFEFQLERQYIGYTIENWAPFLTKYIFDDYQDYTFVVLKL